MQNEQKKHQETSFKNKGPGPMGRGPFGGSQTTEKPANFKESLKKLALNMKKYWSLTLFALLLAGISAVIVIMAPNKLSTLTDEITKGLIPNTEMIAKLSTDITSNLNEENLEKVSINIINSESLSQNDKNSFFETMNQIKTSKTEEELFSHILKLPSSILKILFPELIYNKTSINTDEQLKFLSLIGSVNEDTKREEILLVMDKFPSNIYNLIEPKIDIDIIKAIAIGLLILYGSSAIFSYIQGLTMVNVSNKYSKDLRENASKKINKLPLKYFDANSVGNTLSIITNDIDTIGQSMNQSLSTLVSGIATLIGAIIMMFITNVIMALTAIASSLFGFAFMFLILKKSQKYFVRRQKELGKVNGHIEEIFSGHNVVKLNNGKKDSDKNFNQYNEALFDCERKSQFLSSLMFPMMGFIGNFGYVAVCIVGAALTINGNITFGVIVAFILYVRIFSNPLGQLAQAMTSLQSTAAASERVFAFLEEEEEMNDETNKTKKLNKNTVEGNISFKNVKFGYNKDKIIIKDFSIDIKSGQKIAIVGPTGAGKTTLVNLLMKFYDIDSGTIKIDGISINDLTRENIHDLFIMVLQDTWLFNATIRDNIKYNKENVTDEEIKKACQIVGVDHFIKSLPNGLDNLITDADSISAGQKQLLTIARGMIENAPLLILDEATSNVDTRTEELVQKAMDKLTEGRTSFIIAHRLSTIKNADIILVMDKGNIIEKGNHKFLMKQKGFYADLYNSQFTNS